MVLSLSTVNRVDELIARAQSEGRAPSVIGGIVREGTLAHVASAGEEPAPDRALQYRIGSITKSLTAALVLGLRDEGRLSLEDRLGEHVDGVSPGVGEVRLRALLGHAGGLAREPVGDWWERSAGVPLDRLLAEVTDAKIAFSPYGRYHYSNLAYGLLGAVVEHHTGSTWWQATVDRLLTPLGMQRTTYHPEEPFARGYVVHPWHATLREEPRHDSGAMAPAGQVWSTLEDLARWGAVLAATPPGGEFGAVSPVAPAAVAEMAAPVVMADPDGWTYGYGLGLQLWRSGDRVFAGHTGSMPGYLAVVMSHRPSRTAVVAFANTYSLTGASISELGLSLMEAVLDGEPAPLPAPWRPGVEPPAHVAPLCGRWWWMGHEFEARWDQRHGALVLQGTRPGSEQWRFRETARGWLGTSGDNAGEILAAHRADDGVVEALSIATCQFTREPLPAE